MKNRRKIFYEVWRSDGLWWFPSVRKWMSIADCKNIYGEVYNCSNKRRFNTANKAFRHINLQPSGSMLIRIFIKHGNRYVQEFEKI